MAEQELDWRDYHQSNEYPDDNEDDNHDKIEDEIPSGQEDRAETRAVGSPLCIDSDQTQVITIVLLSYLVA